MARLPQFIECVSQALCRYATAALARLVPFETALHEVAKHLHQSMGTRFTVGDVRASLRELVSSPPETIELAIHDGIDALRPPVDEEFRDTLIRYLWLMPEVIRQALRRPGDPDGESVPEQFCVERPEDWLLFLPDRLPRFRPGEHPRNLDSWHVDSLRGLGPHAEVWEATDPMQPELSPGCLKFITDPKVREAFKRHVPALKRIMMLDVINGLIPLRSIYTRSEPPCLEYIHLPGYDLANVMNDARWRDDRPRPEQAAMVARRIARIVGKLHRQNPVIVHRGIKPSNVLLCPTDEGRVSVWLSDIGWGQIVASLDTAQAGLSERYRRSIRGSFAPLYASPQQAAGSPPDPRDDVHAIGVLWYQLLKRDPMAPPPTDPGWSTEFRRHGLGEAQGRVIASCLADDPAQRPADGQVLADRIAATATDVLRNGDSGTIRLKGGTEYEMRRAAVGEPPRLRIKRRDEAELE